MVHAASNTGYQGFQGFSTRPPPVLKPGETLDSRKTKFRNAGDGLSNSIASDMRDTTISATMSCGLSLSDYCVPDRRGVSAIFATASPPSKPCPGITLSRQSYCLDAINAPKSGAKASPPEWISKVSVNSVVARQMKSSYQMDLGMAGESPSGRPFVAKTGMASTTMDLCEGTAKATYHIPGYSGHIPCSSRNPTVAEHADGAAARPQRSTLRLYHRHNLPGYTGHNPSTAKNDKGPRFSGSNPLTSSGAMVIGEVL
jgi:hypothetical protein